MRVIVCVVVLLCCIEPTTAQARANFCKKLKNIAITFWSQDNLCKIADLIVEDVRNVVPMADISDNLMGYVTKVTPPTDYLKLLSLMTSMDSCLKGTNSKTMDVLKLAVPVFMNQLKAPYNKMTKKAKAMQKNKKAAAQQTNQMYTIGTAAVTKPLVQKIVTGCSKKMSAKQWECSVKNLPTLIAINQYNTKKGG